jgi:hypothetical protein
MRILDGLISSIIFAINELKHESEIECLITMYFANFHCHIKYSILCWENSIDAKRVFKLQKYVVLSIEMSVENYLKY